VGRGERSLESPDPVWDGPQTEQRRNQRAPRFCSTLEAEDKAVKDCLGVSKSAPRICTRVNPFDDKCSSR
jgi:hypothetical protein